MSILNANQFALIPKKLSSPYFGDNIIMRYGVEGDGTCFFYSLCAILNIDNFVNQPLKRQIEIGREFRCGITQGLSWEEWQTFVQTNNIDTSDMYEDMDTLKAALCSHEKWADEPMIRFVMNKFKINLLFLDESLNKLYCGVSETDSTMTGIIYWLDRSHFEPLARLNALDVHNDKVALQFQFLHTTDHEFVQHLMTKYGYQCHL